MSERLNAVITKNGAQVDSVKAEGKLVFNLQKLCVKQIEYRKNLWMHGVDQNGFSVAVKILDFEPTFMMLSLDTWDEDDEMAADDLVDFMEEVNRATALHGNSEKIKYAEFVYMTPFVGFTNNRKDRMVKFVCNNINDAQTVIKHLSQNRHTLYHDDFDFTNQFLQQTGYSYQDWYQLDPIRFNSNSLTHASLEGYCYMENMSRFEGKINVTTPPLIKAFIRIKAISRDGVVEKKVHYHPDPTRPCDRIIAMGISYTWSDDQSSTPFREIIYTTIPSEAYVYPEDRKLVYRLCPTERDLLEAFRRDIVDVDPDDLFFFPDQFHTLNYFAARVSSQSATHGLKFDRFKTTKARTFKESGRITNTRIETRNIFNMESALQKKVFISVESYDLYTCSCHGQLRKEKKNWSDLLHDNTVPNKMMADGHTGRQLIFQMLVQDMQLLTELERDMGMRLEYANVCKASDTDLTDVVSRGEQIRVFNYLTHLCVDMGFYVNREKIAQKAMRFRIADRPPTYTDPPELKMNTDLRNECKEYLKEKLEHHIPKKASTVDMGAYQNAMDQFMTAEDSDSDDDEDTKNHAKDGEEAEGGNVMKPSCRWWDEMRVFIWDFASLYPSIMMAFNLSYENLVFDEKYMDLPGVKYLIIPINKYETVASADLPGVIPKMLRKLVDNRSALKKQMNAEQDPFQKQIKNFEQNSMKVLCNATYGFCGAEKRGAMLAVKPIMYMVTALGRYLQKDCANYVGEKYGIPTIYGDSVTGNTPVLLKDGKGRMFYREIRDLPLACHDVEELADKELMDPEEDLMVWSDKGWTRIQKLIRHKSAKKLYQVTTNSGVVTVTEDHSLLNTEGREIKPTDLTKESKLLHRRLPKSLEISGKTPDHSLKEAVFSNQLEAALYFWQLESREENPQIWETADGRWLICGGQVKADCQVISVKEVTTSHQEYVNSHQEYVYDLETDNHHFSAGIGRLVVHNTDSIFTLIKLWDPPKDPETGITPLPTIDQLCEETAALYEMNDFFETAGGFTWPQVVNHYAHRKRDPLDVTKFSYQHQVNAFLYLISEKLCTELTARFRYPVIMEFENMADKVWMGWVKKHYCYRFWKENDPSKVKYIKITGMPVKKREWSPWTRSVLMGVTDRILNDKTDEIEAFLDKNLTELVSGQVPIRRLMVSKGYKNKAAYKHFRQIHLQVMLKIEERTRWPVKDKSRVYYVVIKGNDKLYMRSETPDFAVEHRLELDMEYYLKNQFEKPMRKLLTYHPHLFNFDTMFKTYMKRLKMRMGNLGDVSNFRTSTKRKMTGDELMAKRQKTAKMTQNRKRKRQATSTHAEDPFARFKKAKS